MITVRREQLEESAMPDQKFASFSNTSEQDMKSVDMSQNSSISDTGNSKAQSTHSGLQNLAVLSLIFMSSSAFKIYLDL